MIVERWSNGRVLDELGNEVRHNILVTRPRSREIAEARFYLGRSPILGMPADLVVEFDRDGLVRDAYVQPH